MNRTGAICVPMAKFSRGAPTSTSAEVAVERPLSIALGGEPLATTMRTPGHDEELVVGFLLSEGLVHRASDINDLAMDGDSVVLTLADAQPQARRRGTLTTAACGVCGRTTIDDLVARCAPVGDRSTWDPAQVERLTTLLGTHQPLFARTGGLHAAALIGLDEGVRTAREDVGRHNAVDKVVGRALLDGILPLTGYALVVSGRTSFEIVQKAAMAGIGLIAGVSAPSSLAIDVAMRAHITLVGFARGVEFNVYAGWERLGVPGPTPGVPGPMIRRGGRSP